MNSISYVWGAYHNFFFLLPHHFRIFFQLTDENILLNNKKRRGLKCMHSPRGWAESYDTFESYMDIYLDSLLLCVCIISSTHIVTSRKIKGRSRVCLHQVNGYRTTKRCYHIRHVQSNMSPPYYQTHSLYPLLSNANPPIRVR